MEGIVGLLDGPFSSSFAAATVVFSTVIGFFLGIERVASSELKVETSRWMRNYDPSAATAQWATHCAKLFDAVFGPRHFSLKCLRRSILASALSSIFFLSVWYVLNAEALVSKFGPMRYWALNLFDLNPVIVSFSNPPWWFWLVLYAFAALAIIITAIIVFTLVSFIPDYISLIETRIMLRILMRTHNLGMALTILLTDILLSLTIFILVILLIGVLFDIADPSISEFDLLRPETYRFILYDSDENLGDELRDMFSLRGTGTDFILPGSVFLYSSLFTSFWLWAYASVSALNRFAKLMSPTWSIIHWGLDFTNKPFTSLGAISGTMSAAATFLFAYATSG